MTFHRCRPYIPLRRRVNRAWLTGCSGRFVAGLLWLLTGCLGAASVSANPVAWDTTAGGWKSRQSAHFQIFYRPPLAAMAQRSLALAEQAHQRLLPFFSDASGQVRLPPERTRMVLVDEFDLSNGWATPFPFAQIRLYASPPQDVNGLDSMDDWLHGLILHEYVHILHSEMASGSAAGLRRLFGRTPLLPLLVPLSSFPHALSPPLLLEGLAVYLETDQQHGYGRLQSNYYRMLMRAEVASGELMSLSEAVTPGRSWPANRAYLYGGYFIDFLVRRYGEDSVRRYLQYYSNEVLLYFTQQGTARQVFGHSFESLWQAFLADLRQQFASAGTAGGTSAEVQVWQQQLPRMPRLAAAQQQLYTLADSRHERQSIQHWPQPQHPQQPPQRLVHSNRVTDLDVSAGGVLLTSRALTYASGRVWNDLFIWQPQRGWQALTRQQRFRKARWLSNTQILASRSLAGISELWLLTLDDQQQLQQSQRLWRGTAGQVVADFDVWQQQLVASIKQPGQGWNLYHSRINATAALNWQPLTNSRAYEQGPRFSADGRLLFSADYHGRFNIYRLDPAAWLQPSEQPQLEQLTHSDSGAFTPLSVGQQLFYSRYRHDGFELVSQPLTAGYSQLSRDSLSGRYDYPLQPQQPAEVSPEQDYTVISPAFYRSLQPHSWTPYYLQDGEQRRVGLATAGTDALGRQRWSLLLNHDSRQQQFNGQFLWQYDNRWSLGFSRDHTTLGNWLRRDDSWLLQRDWLLPQWQDQLSLHSGLSYEHQRLLATELSRDESLVGAALRFNNQQFFIDVAGVGWGSDADLVFETNDVLASDYSGDVWQGRWRHHFDLPGRSSLSYSLALGKAGPQAQAFVLGGEQGEQQRLFGRNEYRLRGYDQGVQSGHFIHQQTLQLGFPLARIERNWGLNPLGLGDISGRLFIDSGRAWFRRQQRDQLTGIGVEIRSDIILGYRLLAPLTLGLAKGLNPANGEQRQFYLRFGLLL